jgi:hypothetical protein
MLNEMKAAVERSSATLIPDALGVLSLFGLLFLGLSMPALY